ncbi:MAG: hypothetical protein WHT09_14680 [Thermogutta sp.]
MSIKELVAAVTNGRKRWQDLTVDEVVALKAWLEGIPAEVRKCINAYVSGGLPRAYAEANWVARCIGLVVTPPSDHVYVFKDLDDATATVQGIEFAVNAWKHNVQLKHLVQEATPATPASSGGDAQANLSVTDVYVPATAVFRLQEKYKTYKQFKRWLDSIPPDVIRRKKPSRNRLLIHAADFVKYWRRMFDATFEILDEVAERMETVRDKKRNKAHKQKGVKAEQLNTLFIPGYGR